MIRENGVAVCDVSEVTGFPEMLDGRVKTLHPKIAGGILAIRGSQEHMRAIAEHGIAPIDMVVVNLYRFEEVAAKTPELILKETLEPGYGLSAFQGRNLAFGMGIPAGSVNAAVAAMSPVPLAASTCRLEKPDPESSGMTRLCRAPGNAW